MGYAEAIKMFLVNFRYVFLALSFFGSIYFVYRQGVKDEHNRNVIEAQQVKIKVDEQIETLNKKAMESTLQSSNYAQQVESIGLQHDKELANLHNQLNAIGLHQRPGLCASHPAEPSSNHNPGKVIITSAVEAEISAEFKEFLVSLTQRADDTGNYAEIANEWLTEQCKSHKEIFSCNE